MESKRELCKSCKWHVRELAGNYTSRCMRMYTRSCTIFKDRSSCFHKFILWIRDGSELMPEDRPNDGFVNGK